MFLDNLKTVVQKNKGKVESVFLRNLLKEQLQYYLLDFIYSSDWGEKFLFKGGTCLRFCFDLPRLSEDLDFDIKDYPNFNLGEFKTAVKNYFEKGLQYKEIRLKTAGNDQQLFLKFPVMDKLGLKENRSESNILFLRLDLAEVDSQIYNQQVSLVSTNMFNFIIQRYSLEDLFASKITAILTRSFKKGKGDKITFKGRDYFDLIWFLERNVQPDFERIEDLTGWDKSLAVEKLDRNINEIEIKYLKEDLMPLFRTRRFVDDFCSSFLDLYEAKKGILD